MSRGRKKVVSNNSDWESVFYNSVGTYVQYINLKLSEHIKAEPLSKHIKIVGGYAFKSSQYKKQGVPVIRISDFSNEKIVLDDVVYYDESKDLERYELNEGDIVIALTGGTIAKLGIVQKGIGKLYLNQRVGKFEVLHPEEFETEYVYWIARSVQSIIKNLAWGAAIPNVSPKQIEELQFPIPDKETQNGIIDFLNDLRANEVDPDKEYFNSKIEDNIIALHTNLMLVSEISSELKQQQDLLIQLLQSFSKEAMQGKLTEQNKKDGDARELLKIIREKKDKLIAEKKLKKDTQSHKLEEETIPFTIPLNWVWCRLSDICYYITDGTHQTPTYYKDGIIFLSSKNVTSGKIDWENIKYIDQQQHVEMHKRVAPQLNDILLAKNGTTGVAALVDKEVIFDIYVSLALLRPFEEIYPKFLLHFINSNIAKSQFNKRLKGIGVPNLHLNEIREVIIPLPPFSEQLRIVDQIESLKKLSDELLQNIIHCKLEIGELLKTLLEEVIGVKSSYDITKDKSLKQKIKRIYTDEKQVLNTISMKIIEILQTSQEPISSTVVWNSSEYSKDIEAFYAELKRLIDIEKLVVEEKRGKESFLKLATNEN